MAGANRQQRLPSTIGRPGPHHRSDHDLNYTSGDVSRCASPDPYPTVADALTVCRSRSAGRLYAGSAAADRGREVAEQRHGQRREQSCNRRRVCKWSPSPPWSLAPTRTAARGAGWADLRPTGNRWALTHETMMAAHGRTLSRLFHRACVSRVCAGVRRSVCVCRAVSGGSARSMTLRSVLVRHDCEVCTRIYE